jgi:hypothetical protein
MGPDVSDLPTIALVRTLKRRHPHMSYLWEAIECPYCHAPVGEPCKTKRGTPTDMSHMGRIDEFKYAK